jgi:flagellar hook-basal body complex protein FliE
MDLRMLPGVDAARSALAANAAGAKTVGAAAAGAAGAVSPAPGAGGVSFAKALDSALKTVSTTQNQASALQRQYQMGVETVSIEDTMVAMQKAQIGFQSALAVRNRLVSAYTDIMNMQV